MSADNLLRQLVGLPVLSETQLRMREACPDSTLRDIVADNRSGISQSASMLPESKQPAPPQQQGSGWRDAKPLAPTGFWDSGTLPKNIVRVDEELAAIQQAEDARAEAQERHLAEGDVMGVWSKPNE